MGALRSSYLPHFSLCPPYQLNFEEQEQFLSHRESSFKKNYLSVIFIQGWLFFILSHLPCHPRIFFSSPSPPPERYVPCPLDSLKIFKFQTKKSDLRISQKWGSIAHSNFWGYLCQQVWEALHLLVGHFSLPRLLLFGPCKWNNVRLMIAPSWYCFEKKTK